MTLRDSIARVLEQSYGPFGDGMVDRMAGSISRLPEIADLQKKLAEVEAERDEWKGVYEQADRHHMEAERSTKAAEHNFSIAYDAKEEAEAAIPRAYQMGLNAAAEALDNDVFDRFDPAACVERQAARTIRAI